MVEDVLADRLVGTTWTARDLALEDALAVVREAGLIWVEVWAEGVHLDPRAAGYQSVAVRRVLAEGLAVASVHLPFHAVSEGAPADVRTADWVQLCTDTMRRAAELGASMVVAHPVIHRDDGEPDQHGVSRLTNALHRLARTAEELGLRLAVENMHGLRGPTLRSVAEITAALEGSSASAGVCLDVGHAIFNGYTGDRLGDEVRAAGTQLISTHVHDSDRIGADPHLLPGDGIAGWGAYLGALVDTGYTGRFVLEVNGHPDPLERLTTATARFSHMLRDAGLLR